MLACAGGLTAAPAQERQPGNVGARGAGEVWPRSPAVKAASAVRLVQPKAEVMPATALQVDDQPPIPPEPIPSGESVPNQSEITLEELQGIALANNPTLAQSAARVDAARGRFVQAGLYPNPSVGYMADEIGMAGRAGMQGFALMQEIVRGNKLGLDRAAASQEIAQAEAQFAAQRQRVLNDVRAQFYSLLVAQRSMQLSDELAELAKRGFDTAEQLFKPPVMLVSRADVVQADIELSNARMAADLARNGYLKLWRQMAATIGAPDMQPVTAIGSLDAAAVEMSWSESLSRLLATSPELAAARAAAARASWVIARARAEPIPNLNVQASVQHDNEGGDDVANVMVMFPLTIHDKNQGAIRAAVAERREAQAEIARLELALQTRLAAAFERYSNARTQVDRYSREILPNARTSLDLVTRGYRNGEFGYLTLLEAQRTLSRTNLAYLNALEQLWESTTAIEGLLLSDSLQMPPGR
jgi:cobalt-zinc-cadmium efflux system outer membrane protein